MSCSTPSLPCLFPFWEGTKTSRARALSPVPSAAAQFQVPACPLGMCLFGCATQKLGLQWPSSSAEPPQQWRPGPACCCPQLPLPHHPNVQLQATHLAVLFALLLGPDPLLPMPAPSLFLDVTALPLADGLRLTQTPSTTLSSSLSPSLLLPGLSAMAQGGNTLSCVRPNQATTGVDLPGMARRRKRGFPPPTPTPNWCKDSPAGAGELQLMGFLCRGGARWAGVTTCVNFGSFFNPQTLVY